MSDLIIHTYGAIRRLEKSMSGLKLGGLGPGTEVFDILAKARADIWKSVGIKQPKTMSILRLLLGLSPGSIRVIHDAESGWMTEAREKPGAPPVYHYVSDEVAAQILQGKLTHELELELMKPDEYQGE